ncbi:MAG: ABC transporter ATP-binding protein, partial [Chloroflexi bacterium]|nr:ABC transporter ATP-binding protein [Chloroflexota bacterium]
MPEPLLHISDLHTRYGATPVLRGASLSLASGEALALTGPSGSGKSTLALAILRLLPPGGAITHGAIRFGGANLLGLPPGQMNRVRGTGIGMIFQQPRPSLTPVRTVGSQLIEVLRVHRGLDRPAAQREAAAWFERVGLSGLLDRYPGELSGGQAQRAALAVALAPGPDLLIADEPTSSLDTDTEARILDLIADLQRETATAVLLITHDA